MLVAVPIGLFSAIYLSRVCARRRFRALGQADARDPGRHPDRGLRLLRRPDRGAADPRRRRSRSGSTSPRRARSPPALVMGIMIIPFVSSLSDDVINAVPQSLRDGSFALGATKSETIRQVRDPGGAAGHRRRRAARRSRRAIGETMIVVMAAGLAANLTANPLAGGHHGHGADRHAAGRRPGVRQRRRRCRPSRSAWCCSSSRWCLNVIALHVVEDYREKYD